MNPWLESFAHWLLDVYAGATLLLGATVIVGCFVRQPARRLPLSWAAVIGLCGLALLAAVPHWPRMHCMPPDPLELELSAQVTHPAPELSTRTSMALAPLGREANIDVAAVEKALKSLRQVDKSSGNAEYEATLLATVPSKVCSPDERTDFTLHLWSAMLPDSGRSVWMPWLIVAFTAGSGLALAWLLVGGIRAVWLVRRSREAPLSIHTLLKNVIGQVTREPRLRLSEGLGQPVAMGAIRPAILLPVPQAEQVPPPQLEAVLAHEWAHIRRGDLWLLALSRTLLPLLFAHPLYWWLRGRIRQDQEALADAAAVGHGSAVDYAATLLAWFRLGNERHSAVALAFGGRPSQLKRRIAMLLNPDWPVETHCPGRLRWSITALAAVGVLTLSVLTLRPGAPAEADEPKPVPNEVQVKEFKPTSFQSGEEMKMAKPAMKPVGKTYVAAALAGKVLNSNEKPVAGAKINVLAYSKNRRGPAELLGQADSDSDGRFKLNANCPMPPTQFDIVTIATAKNAAPGWTTGISNDLKITLAEGEALRGRLIDLQGQPAAGVKVYVSRVGARPANDNGMYRAFLVDGVGHGFDDEETPSENANAQLFVGAQIMMSNGQTTVNINADGKPPEAQPVPAVVFPNPTSAVPFWPEAVVSDAAGNFTIRGVGRGQGLGLQVRDDRFGLQVLDIPAQGDKSRDVITLPLAPARMLEGTVTAADTGKPIPNARIQVNPPQGSGAFSLAFSGIGGVGGTDWKGRQGLGTATDLFYAVALAGGTSAEELPKIEIRADENGRYRVNLPIGDSPSLRVSAPDGEPFLKQSTSVNWRKGAARQTLDLQLTRGVPVQGKVTESGQPVSGARVDFWSKGLKLPEGIRPPRSVTTGKDGKFTALLPPAHWFVLVNGATSDYVCQKLPANSFSDGQQQVTIEFDFVPDGATTEVRKETSADTEPRFFYPDAWQELDLKATSKPAVLSLTLRRVVLKGRVIDTEGKPVAKATMFFQHPTPHAAAGSQTAEARLFAPLVKDVMDTDATYVWTDLSGSTRRRVASSVQPTEVRDGQFEIFLRDLEAPYYVYILDRTNRLGGLAEFTGKLAGSEPVTVRLAPCGTVSARFVDEHRKPLAEYHPLVWALQNGSANSKEFRFSFDESFLSPGAVWAGHLDKTHDVKGPSTDKDGRVTFSNLISGVPYRIWNGPTWQGFNIVNDDACRNFTVGSLKTTELGDITIKRVKVEPPTADSK